MENIRDYEAMAKLNLDDRERQWVQDTSDMLIKSFSELQSIGTDDVEPLVSVLDIRNVLRDDQSVKMLSREKLLSNAPEQYDGYFQAPKTLE